jgi:Na+/H+-dicarboxylate symporter
LRTIVYYMITTAIAVVIGIVLVQVIQPGKGTDDTFAFVSESVLSKEGSTAVDTLLNVFRGQPGDPNSGMIPSNIFGAAAQTNVLALIGFALLFGGALTTVGEVGKPVVDFFSGANEVVMKMVQWVIWFTPLGVFGLVAANIAARGGGEAFAAEFAKLGKYVATVSVGLLLHGAVLCLILWLFAKQRPLQYVLGVGRALLTAVTTASSSATLPVTMECVEHNNGVSKESAGFVLPLGATINMDGTALYQAVAAVFIAQTLGMEIGLGGQLTIVLTAVLASIGTAAVPGAGIIMLVIILEAVGIPSAGIALILGVDRLLDMVRTMTNVTGDATVACIVAAREGQLAPAPP